MHRIFVEEKKWIEEDRYLHALNYCMLLPGPEAQQLATYVGWLLHGVKGGLIAGALFVLPGAGVVLALSWLYVTAGQQPLVAAAFSGIKAAVLALVLEAMLRIGKRALKKPVHAWIAVASVCALLFWNAPFPLVILVAVGVGLMNAAPAMAQDRTPTTVGAVPSNPSAFAAAGVWTLAWLAPVGFCVLALGPEHVLTQVGVLFSTLAVVTFGGAYAALVYLQQQSVEALGWLTADQMIDGLGLAETTPGPLVLVNEFVGFVAGWQNGGPVIATLAALLAAWCTFAPSFVWIFAGAPYAESLRSSRLASSALQAVTAAVLGVIANLAVWFALHVVFGIVGNLALPLGMQVPLPQLETVDPAAAAMCVVAAVALLGFKVGVIQLVLGAAATGILVHLAQLAV